MKSQLCMVLLVSAALALEELSVPKGCAKGKPLTCPKLNCDEELEPNVCFEFDQATASVIKRGQCYDKESAKQTDQVLTCPFNMKEFMWIDERLQGQGADRKDMCCK